MRTMSVIPPPTNRGVRVKDPNNTSPERLSQISSSVDWLTATTTKTASGESWKELFHRKHKGQHVPTNFFGFQCVRDETGMTYGQRPSDGRYIFILAGDAAADHWKTVYHKACKITRIDLTVDVYTKDAIELVENSSRLVMNKHYETRRRYHIHQSLAGGPERKSSGSTLYVGSRQSTAYGRLYDKGIQTKSLEAGRWFRYEVEYKDYGAWQVAQRAAQQEPKALGEWVERTVHDWFLARDVVPVFGVNSHIEPFRVRSFIKETTKEKKLLWLHSQVRPTVEYLIKHGMKDEAITALGLSGATYDMFAKLTEINRDGKLFSPGTGKLAIAKEEIKEL